MDARQLLEDQPEAAWDKEVVFLYKKQLELAIEGAKRMLPFVGFWKHRKAVEFELARMQSDLNDIQINAKCGCGETYSGLGYMCKECHILEIAGEF